MICCTADGVAFKIQAEDSYFKIKSQEIVQMYQVFSKEDLPPDLRYTVNECV